MPTKPSTDPELIRKFLQAGGKIKKGRTHSLKKNIVYNSGNHHKLVEAHEPESIRDTWDRVRKSS